jgi:hypothetical protein
MHCGCPGDVMKSVNLITGKTDPEPEPIEPVVPDGTFKTRKTWTEFGSISVRWNWKE